MFNDEKQEINTTMKALVLQGIGDLRLEEIPVPEMKDDEVLIKVKNCGICSSDLERVFVTGTYYFPTIPGHEFCGEIIATKNQEDEHLIGKVAAVFPLLPCFECDACKKEQYAQCSNYNYFGSRCDGAFAEYLAVPKWNLVYADNLKESLAALCEPAAVATHAIKIAGELQDKKIFVMGSGTIGLLIALFLKSKGYNVSVGARKDKSIEFIESLGLTAVHTNSIENEMVKQDLYDVIFEAVGSNESISKCIELSENFAKIILIGNPKQDLQIEKNIYWKILRKQISVCGTWNSSFGEKINDWKEALENMKADQSLFEKLITHVYNLDEYKKAFETLKNKNEFKVKIMFQNK